jgi:short subunit fatty acids transporter
MTKEYTKGELENVINVISGNRESSMIQYQNQVLTNYTMLLDKVKKENKQLANSFDYMKNQSSADGQKSKYVNQSTQILEKIYNVLFWIYLVVAVGLSVVIYMYSKQGIYMKVFFILLVLLFPYYIYPLENFVFEIMRYLYSLVLSVVYVNNYS